MDGAHDPDAALIARIGGGDEAAFRAFVSARLPRVHALAWRMLRDTALAEDVAQEAFLRVWRHAGDWRPGPARFDTWLHRVVLNLCTDRLRRLARDRPEPEPPDRADPAPDPEARLADADRAARLRAALDRLPRRQKEALMLQTYGDLPQSEIAASLRISVAALESLLSRARRTLRTLLVETDP